MESSDFAIEVIMDVEMTRIEVDRKTAGIIEALKAKAEAQGVSLATLLQPLAEQESTKNGESQPPRDDDATIGERLERKGLIGIIDSSEPPDPTSPHERPPLYDLIADKFRRQGLKLP